MAKRGAESELDRSNRNGSSGDEEAHYEEDSRMAVEVSQREYGNVYQRRFEL